MENISRLPKGLWYEAERRRFRVRRYHNKVVYGPYYFRTFDRALLRLEELNEEIAAIPKEDRQSTVFEKSKE